MVVHAVFVQTGHQLALRVLRNAHTLGQHQVKLECRILVVRVVKHYRHLLLLTGVQRNVGYRQVVGQRPAHHREQDSHHQ